MGVFEKVKWVDPQHYKKKSIILNSLFKILFKKINQV
jgi:hypothetical protein